MTRVLNAESSTQGVSEPHIQTSALHCASSQVDVKVMLNQSVTAYPVNPLSTKVAPAGPSQPAVSFVFSSAQTLPVSTFPVSPMRSSGSVVPSFVSSPQSQPLYTIPTRPADPNNVPPSTPKPLGPGPSGGPWSPTQPQGASPKPPGYSSGPAQPPVDPSHPAQHPYSVHQPPAGPSPQAQPKYSVQQPPAGLTTQAQPTYSASRPPSDPTTQAQPTYSTSRPPPSPTTRAQPTYSASRPPPGPTTQAQPPYSVSKPPAGPSRPARPPSTQGVPAAPPAHPGAASLGGNGECAQHCNVKCQSADIAFDVSQCKTRCLSGCASGSEAHILVSDGDTPGKSVLHPPGHKNLKGGSKGKGVPGPAVGVDATSYEACVSACRAKMQHAHIAMDVSQGEMDCKAACARQSSSRVGIISKKDTIDTRSKHPKHPKPAVGPAIGADATSYEVCVSDCSARYQHAGVALGVSQGEMDCKAACAKAASSKVGIFDKRDTLDKRGKHPKQPKPATPAVGADATSYEACLSDCSARWQHAGVALGVSQGEMDCKSACAKAASSKVGILDKRDTETHDKNTEALDKRTKKPKPQGPAVGAASTTYEACVSACNARYQHAGIALGVSQGDSHCKAACARGASSNVGIIDKREILDTAEESLDARTIHPKPATPALHADATTYEACMLDCSSRYQHTGLALGVSQGEKHCKSACAKYESAKVGIIDKRETLETSADVPLDTRATKHHKPPPAPAVGVDATTYEACVSDCKARHQHAHIAMDVSQGEMDCKSACIHYASSKVGIFDKRDSFAGLVSRGQPIAPMPMIGLETSQHQG
ncbi:hypothetical protein F4861DRAFT_151468 [Xylaria intraflava]|nr:hypothetical protein F4861DRAFT_151468 [Xylaria intraflava]